MSEHQGEIQKELGESEREGRFQVLRSLTRRYWFLKAQAAAQGRPDPSVLMEIQDLEKEIEKAKNALQSWDAAGQGALESRLNRFRESMKHQYPNDWFDFMNRVREKQCLRTPSTRRYLFVVDAPPDYGKSALLSHIGAEYIDEGWSVIELDFKHDSKCDTSTAILPALVFKAKSGDPYGWPEEATSSNQAEGTLWSELVRIVNSKGGLLLLLDSVDRAPDEAPMYLKDNLIPDLHQRLADLIKQLKLRCIVAGRNIEKTWAPNGSQEHIELVKLSPFDVQVVEDELIRIYGHGQGPSDAQEIRRVARRMWYLAGGHPRLIARGLRQIESNPFIVSRDMTREDTEVFRQVHARMQGQIPGKLKKIFEQIAILRSFDSTLLQEFGQRAGFIPDPFPTGLQAFTLLTEHKLIAFDSSTTMYRDEIYRRVSLEHAHLSGQTQATVSLHAIAVEIYKSKLEDSTTCLQFGGIHLVVEALYHSFCAMHDPDTILEDLKTYLSHLTKAYGRPRASDIAIGIIDRLRRDHELQEEIYMAIKHDDFLESNLIPILEGFVSGRN